MKTFREKLQAFALQRNAKGCSFEETRTLGQEAGITLPDTYREFLSVAGSGIDDFLAGSDFTVIDLDDTREAADDLLVEAGLGHLPPEAFVFAMHQGYQFYFFLNDAVYYYRETMDHIEKRFDSFEEFFDSIVACIEGKPQ